MQSNSYLAVQQAVNNAYHRLYELEKQYTRKSSGHIGGSLRADITVLDVQQQIHQADLQLRQKVGIKGSLAEPYFPPQPLAKEAFVTKRLSPDEYKEALQSLQSHPDSEIAFNYLESAKARLEAFELLPSPSLEPGARSSSAESPLINIFNK